MKSATQDSPTTTITFGFCLNGRLFRVSPAQSASIKCEFAEIVEAFYSKLSEMWHVQKELTKPVREFLRSFNDHALTTITQSWWRRPETSAPDDNNELLSHSRQHITRPWVQCLLAHSDGKGETQRRNEACQTVNNVINNQYPGHSTYSCLSAHSPSRPHTDINSLASIIRTPSALNTSCTEYYW